MSDNVQRLSAQSFAVLEMIAAGRTYEQILSAYPDLAYPDIFQAAEEALALAIGARANPLPTKKYTLSEKRERHEKAYEPWSAQEDQTLSELVRSGETVARIAGRLQRNRGAIRSRMMKLSLVDLLASKELDRFRRIVESRDHP